MYCDPFKISLGCVLMQRSQVIAHASRQLRDHECNYLTHKSRVSGSSLCAQNMIARLVWDLLGDIHRSSQSAIYYEPKGFEFEAKASDQAISIL